jgi:hypothetical protein
MRSVVSSSPGGGREGGAGWGRAVCCTAWQSSSSCA